MVLTLRGVISDLKRIYMMYYRSLDRTIGLMIDFLNVVLTLRGVISDISHSRRTVTELRLVLLEAFLSCSLKLDPAYISQQCTQSSLPFLQYKTNFLSMDTFLKSGHLNARKRKRGCLGEMGAYERSLKMEIRYSQTSDSLTLSALRVISIKFLLVVPMYCKTE